MLSRKSRLKSAGWPENEDEWREGKDCSMAGGCGALACMPPCDACGACGACAAWALCAPWPPCAPIPPMPPMPPCIDMLWFWLM